jgi:hypothetical protein
MARAWIHLAICFQDGPHRSDVSMETLKMLPKLTCLICAVVSYSQMQQLFDAGDQFDLVFHQLG